MWADNDARDELVGHVQAGRARLEPHRAVLTTTTARIPAGKADELRERLSAVLAEFTEAASADGVEAHLFVTWYETD